MVVQNRLLSFHTSLFATATPESKVQATGGLDGGLDIEVTLIKGGEKRQLMLWHISTKDADFLASNFKMSSDDLKNLVVSCVEYIQITVIYKH